MNLDFAQNYQFSVLGKIRLHSVCFSPNKTKQVILVVKFIYNVTIDNNGRYNSSKLRHNRKILCRLDQYRIKALKL